MTSISLSASIRANLLSLQNTTKLLDSTSQRLSTGLKVNSALDNPGAFFTARSLTNRAFDLNTRKDGIGQAISLLESTDKSLTSLTSLVDQAKSVAQQAEEAATSGVTVVSSEKATTLAGATTISTNFNGLVPGTVSADTDTLLTAGFTAGESIIFTINGAATTLSEGTAAGTTVASFVTAINALDTGITAVFNVSTLEIDITGNGGLDITIATGAAAAFDDIGGFKLDGATLTATELKSYATNNTATDQLIETFGVAVADDVITAVKDAGGNTFTVAIGSTIQDLIDNITAADTALTATYNTTTSKIDIKAAENVSFSLAGSGFVDFTFVTNDGTTLTSGVDVTFSKLGSALEVAALTLDFQTLLDQINGLVSDATYKGTNLLKASAALDVKFNADGDSKLTVNGKALENDADGILSGLKFTQKATDYDFTTAGDITSALNDVDAAITELRSIASTFGTSLGIIQTREDFTISLVNALESGAGKLVNASLEEEAAKLLALQTRQALGIQSLAIANTSQQSILALFR